jgi:hypothetical protein
MRIPRGLDPTRRLKRFLNAKKTGFDREDARTSSLSIVDRSLAGIESARFIDSIDSAAEIGDGS